MDTFGLLPNGQPAQRVRLSNEAIEVAVLSYGGTVQSIKLKGLPFSLCLGFETLPEYLADNSCIGAVVGRVANRIGKGRARIDEQLHQFDLNDKGRHTLHGGKGHLATKNWMVVAYTENSLRLQTQLLAGENGFPGTLSVTADYTLHAGGILEVALEARTDAPTLCNLALHPYFNLNGGGDARGQWLSVNATEMTETNDEKIPTGSLLTVENTPWDHRIEKRMLADGTAYDLNYCVADERRTLQSVASLRGRESGAKLQVATTEPGLQVYDGSGLHTPYAGIALEPQCWPDAPNHDHFPSILLRPGEVSRQVTRLTFSRG